MAKDERREHLLLTVDNLATVWNAWSADSDTRYITKSFEDAVNDVLFVWGDGSIPGDLRTMNARIEALGEQWAAWTKLNETSGGKNPLPANSFWKALEALETSRQAVIKPVRKTLEPIADLTAQKVADAQICRMYGFTDDGTPSGTPELWRLQEERAHPGKHTGPGTGWMPPWEKKHQVDETKQNEIVERIKRQRAAKMKLLTEVAPESIEELLANNPGISGKQVCRMKKIEESALIAYCEEHGLGVPQWEAESGNAIQGVHDFTDEELGRADTVGPAAPVTPPRPRQQRPAANDPLADIPLADEPVEAVGDEAEDQALPEGLTLEQEIVMYHKLGTMTPTEIAVAVSSPTETISRQKVNAVVARFQREPEAFEVESTEAEVPEEVVETEV